MMAQLHVCSGDKTLNFLMASSRGYSENFGRNAALLINVFTKQIQPSFAQYAIQHKCVTLVMRRFRSVRQVSVVFLTHSFSFRK